jgi:hypothetical protein
MATVWNKHNIEGLENKDDNKLDMSKTFNASRITIQYTLDAIKGPVMNSTEPEKLPPNIKHETAVYTSIRENIATPFVKSFMNNTPNKPTIDI